MLILDKGTYTLIACVVVLCFLGLVHEVKCLICEAIEEKKEKGH